MAKVTRNKFVYPAGITPRFNPSHIAAAGMTQGLGFSGVATATGGFINLLNGVPGTVIGAVSANTQGVMGPAAYASAGGFTWGSYTTNINSTPGNTMAVILTNKVDNGLAGTLLATNGGSGIFNFGVNNLQPWMFQGSAGQDTGYTTLLNVPYFLAVSSNSSTTNFIVARLDTGQVVSQLTIAAPGTITNAAFTNYNILNASPSGVAFNMNGSMAAAMHAPSYLTPQQLFQWAQDPWAFWYPTPYASTGGFIATIRSILGISSITGVSTITF